MQTTTPTKKVIKVGKRLHEVTTIKDSTGNILHSIVKPLMIKVRMHDVVQAIVGASILAIPVAYSEEVWQLGEALPLANVVMLGILSIVFLAIFVYYNFYRNHLKGNTKQYILRVCMLYALSLVTVAIFLALLQKTPWSIDWLLALKRIIIVSVPASMSAAVADLLK